MRYSLNCLSLPFSANYSSPGYFKCIEITFVPWSFKKYSSKWSADEISLSDGGATEEQISHIPLGWHHRYLTAENKPPTFAGPASLGGKRWKHWEKRVEKHQVTQMTQWPSAKHVQQPAYVDAKDVSWCHGFRHSKNESLMPASVVCCQRKQCLTEPFKNTGRSIVAFLIIDQTQVWYSKKTEIKW